MKDRRGQVALEFLLTYGWAIIILVVVAVLLWQFGMFNPAGQIQPGSSGFWGVTPYDYQYNTNSRLTISIQNNLGGTIEIQGVNITLKGFKEEDSLADGMGMDYVIPQGEKRLWDSDNYIWTTLVDSPARGSQFRAFVSITYNDSRVPGQEYVSSGWIWGNVESA